MATLSFALTSPVVIIHLISNYPSVVRPAGPWICLVSPGVPRSGLAASHPTIALGRAAVSTAITAYHLVRLINMPRQEDGT